MFSAAFVLCVFVSVFNGGISHVPTSVATHAVPADMTSVTTHAAADDDATSITTQATTEESLTISTRAVTEDAITHITEFIQSVSPFSVAQNVSRDSKSRQFAVVNATRFVCGVYTPCGWLTYNAQTREDEQWTDSSCDCRNGTECVRVEDNISIASYEYRCRNITSPASETSQ